jgi:hypothetical protein
MTTQGRVGDPQCPFCGEPVDRQSPLTWHSFVCWEARFTGEIVAPELTGEFAHDRCVAAELASPPPGQS